MVGNNLRRDEGGSRQGVDDEAGGGIVGVAGCMDAPVPGARLEGLAELEALLHFNNVAGCCVLRELRTLRERDLVGIHAVERQPLEERGIRLQHLALLG